MTGTDKTLLIVDDQQFARRLLRDILIPNGYDVQEAGDGASACALIAALMPDLILLDLVMPGMDGIEVCRQIKADPVTAAIPIIVITANTEKELLTEAFAAGADDYLNKPFSSKELLARIRSNLDRAEATGLLRQKVRDTEILLEISQAITSTLETEKILQIIVDKIAGNIAVRRCSIARVNDDAGCAYVLASSDNPAIGGFRIDLGRYPEIREVIRTGRSLIVEDVKSHPLMAGVRDHLADLDIESILVLPVIYRSEVIGTLMLRTARAGSSFTSRELRFCQLVANVSASALKNAHLYEQVREESTELREMKARIEEELRAKEIYESLFEHASDGLIALNARGEPVYMNQSALDMLGYSRDEALGITLSDMIAEESYAVGMENHMNFFLGREHSRKYDLTIVTKGGGRRLVSVSVSPYRIADSLVILALTDVTEERSFQARLEEANERLKGLDRLKSEFFRTATHELRLPVSVINSYSTLIEEEGIDNLTAEQKQYFRAVLDNSARLIELVDDMLDLARIESGQVEMNFEEQSILEPIREVFASLAPYASENGLEISIDPVSEEIAARFDSDQIRCVLTNLVGNAIKFTPPGGKIGISATREEGAVHVSVTDTGVGIPEEYLPRIFDEFCQVRTGASPRRGSGLGLTICKRIVAAHLGEMWVDSAPRKGSRFTFSLPLSPE